MPKGVGVQVPLPVPIFKVVHMGDDQNLDILENENPVMEKKTFEEWIDLKGVETQRTYFFPKGFTYTVDNPVKLFVKKSGSHKLIDSEGKLHYITNDWKTFCAVGEFKFNVE